MKNISIDQIYVSAMTSETFRETVEPLMDGWYDVFSKDVKTFELGQLVHNKQGVWLAALLWQRARRKSYPRDRYLGWHACQQAERLPLIIECVAFQPRLHVPGEQPDYGSLALREAVHSLPLDWFDNYGYQILLADAHLAANIKATRCFSENKWTRTTDKDPRVAASHWVKELVSDAKKIITARCLEKAFAKGRARDWSDPFPLVIEDELLPSLTAAFKDITDPRSCNRHYPLSSLIAISCLALIAGAESVNGIVSFSRRISNDQARLLELPSDKNNRIFQLPKYHSYYRILWKLDHVRIAENFINWINLHTNHLPEILHSDGYLIRDVLFTFINKFNAPPSAYRIPQQPLIGIDTERGMLKRDEHGNLIE